MKSEVCVLLRFARRRSCVHDDCARSEIHGLFDQVFHGVCTLGRIMHYLRATQNAGPRGFPAGKWHTRLVAPWRRRRGKPLRLTFNVHTDLYTHREHREDAPQIRETTDAEYRGKRFACIKRSRSRENRRREDGSRVSRLLGKYFHLFEFFLSTRTPHSRMNTARARE